MGVRPLTSLPATSVSACAAEALHLVRTRAYFADRVDWAAVTRDVTRAAARADTELGLVLGPLWRALRDGHSRLVPTRAMVSNTERRRRLPVGRRLSGGLGYIRLPEFGGRYRSPEATDYVESAWAHMREPAHGWVIDLRGNRGGSVVPMLAAIGPLLGGGEWLKYQRRDGKYQAFKYSAGEITIDNHPVLAVAKPPGDMPTLPVAVLVDERTTSAAEATLVALQGRENTGRFGKSSAGVPTGNVCYRLADDSLLVIAESAAVDRSGRTYTSAIAPDSEGDLSAACSWLCTQFPTPAAGR